MSTFSYLPHGAICACGHELRGEAFHLANLVYQIDTRIEIGREPRRRLIERRDIHAIFSYAAALLEIDLRDDARHPPRS